MGVSSASSRQSVRQSAEYEHSPWYEAGERPFLCTYRDRTMYQISSVCLLLGCALLALMSLLHKTE